MKHSLAPWEIEGQDIYGRNPDGSRNFICSWSGRSADARLIAAAPELMEALEKMPCLCWHAAFDETNCPQSFAQEAIEKVNNND